MKHLLSTWAVIACALAGILQPWAAEAGDRRLSVELALVAGDARMLADPGTPPLRREGLSERIRSSLGSLAMTARYAAQTVGQTNADLLAEIHAMRVLFTAGNLTAFSRQAYRLAASYPIDTSYFEPLAVTPLRLESGRSIYRQYCVGCHTSPDPNARNTAPDLFSMARTESRREFIARLLGGVHGDRTTSLANPFTDEALASLAAYLVSGDPSAGEK